MTTKTASITAKKPAVKAAAKPAAKTSAKAAPVKVEAPAKPVAASVKPEAPVQKPAAPEAPVQKITVLKRECPHAEGSKRAESWAALLTSKDSKDYAAKGGAHKYLARWASKGLITLA